MNFPSVVPASFIVKKVIEIVGDEFQVEPRRIYIDGVRAIDKISLARRVTIAICSQITDIPIRKITDAMGYHAHGFYTGSMSSLKQDLQADADMAARYKALRGRCFEAVYGVSLKEAKSAV